MRDNPNYEVIKEPRGFIKCLEIFLAIFAFSCVTGFRGQFSFHQHVNGTSHRVDGHFKYPFSGSISLNMANDTMKNIIDVPLEIDERSSTEFFVVIGVFCFLYSLGVLVYYTWFEEDNKQPSSATFSPPVIDFVAGGFWAFFWFVSACAQAAAVRSIKSSTDVNELIKSLALCKITYTCSIDKAAKYATLTISILLGFLNVFVWAGNMWFLWKETPWHRDATSKPAVTQQKPQHQPTPPATAI
ncbi:synaptophysin-like isoform X1 [Hydractinia symbiolongicarpus]|uniref:synaptophysin-like isoform X1 n=1 Tax=Hydractinia symbiolongicarpus TaxID=13093 RepID=UPI002550EFA0|nr:synaptophysin-like isoform X1 [Hydractinia symbiolongicarpus]